MIGAIAGDIIGSPYEGMRNNIRTCDFPLFGARSRFTDDTVLTVAVADALMHSADYSGKLKEYYHLYPNAGYGGMFIQWANSASKKPYNSFGNGSAMRVSPVAFTCGTLEEALAEAGHSAAVTHNHPEGVKGAQAVASATFLARTGESKEYIREYTEESFGYDLSEPIDSLREWYALEYDPAYISCQKSVPQAIRAFLDSEDFEDAVRKAVSIGGDSDTIACITGGIAQAYYGVPREIEDQVMLRLDERLSMMTLEFMEKFLLT